jgi:hypothetical protein
LKRGAWLAGAITVGAYALGLFGFLRTGHVSTASAVYNTFGLFTRSFSVPPKTNPSSLPVALEVARFVAPILTVAAAAGVALHIFRDAFDRVTARRRRRDHIVVCGLGRVGMTCAQHLQAAGIPVVAIERDRTRTEVSTMRSAGVPVVAGDATDTEALARAGIEHASRLVWAADDWIDGQAAVAAAMALMSRESEFGQTTRSQDAPVERVPACLVRVQDLSLCSDLRRRALAAQAHGEDILTKGPDVDFFNESENVAQRMLWKATHSYELAAAPSATLWVIGTGLLAEALIVQAARQWLGRTDLGEFRHLTIHLFAENAHDEARRIEALWPEVSVASTIEPHSGPPETASRCDAPVDAAFVIIDRAEQSAAITFRLVDETSAPCIVVTIDKRARALFGSDRVLTFDPIADGLESDELLFDSYELMARMAHTHYLEANPPLRAGIEPDKPAHEWRDLNDFWRASNRDAARFVITNLAQSGFRIFSLRGDANGPSPLEPTVVDALAAREHDRWRSFMARCGWTYGTTRDDTKRKRPDLVAWPDASPDSREYTCEFVRTYPRLLMQLGYEIARVQ